MKEQDRLIRLAKALALTPGSQGLRLEQAFIGGVMRWWLVGCVEGDQALPRTARVSTAAAALDAAEAWLAPEIDGAEEEDP